MQVAPKRCGWSPVGLIAFACNPIGFDCELLVTSPEVTTQSTVEVDGSTHAIILVQWVWPCEVERARAIIRRAVGCVQPMVRPMARLVRLQQEHARGPVAVRLIEHGDGPWAVLSADELLQDRGMQRGEIQGCFLNVTLILLLFGARKCPSRHDVRRPCTSPGRIWVERPQSTRAGRRPAALRALFWRGQEVCGARRGRSASIEL